MLLDSGYWRKLHRETGLASHMETEHPRVKLPGPGVSVLREGVAAVLWGETSHFAT